MNKVILTLALSALLLTSCADVPETVKERAENSSVTEDLESKPDADLVFDTVENVTRNVQSVRENKYQNIIIPEECVFDVEPAERAYIIGATNYENEGRVDIDKRFEDFSMMFVGEIPPHIVPFATESYDAELEKAEEAGREPYDRELFERGNKTSFPPEYGRTGFGYARRYMVEMSTGGAIIAFVLSDWSRKQSLADPAFSYDLRKGELPDISYSVAGEDYSLADALKDADSYISGSLKPFLDNSDGVRPQKLYVMEAFGDEDIGETPGNYYYLIKYAQTVGGIPISNYGTRDQRKDRMQREIFWLLMYERGKFGKVAMDNFFETGRTEQEKLITLDSALAHGEKLLAPFEVYKIKKVSLEYCAYLDGEGMMPKNEIVPYEYRPMWCLTLTDDRDCEFLQFEQRKAIYIDAIDGTVRLWDDFQESFLFDSSN